MNRAAGRPTEADPLELRTDPAPRRRALVVVNPYATTVSDRLRNLVLHALEARFDVEARDTQAAGHACEISREAAWEGYDVVVAFGGDGTVNEVINGLAGGPTPLTCLPGGRTNVYCRLLGIPSDIVDATEHLLAMADRWEPRKVDLGRVNDRRFGYCAGVGVDACVVARVDAHPRLKARFGANYFLATAVATVLRRYVVRPRLLELEAAGESATGVMAIVQNGAYYTYFNDRPVAAAVGAGFDSGTLAGVVLERTSLLDVPSILVRSVSRRLRLVDHHKVAGLPPATELALRSVDGRPLPLHVDGDYVGDVATARFDVLPGALTVVS